MNFKFKLSRRLAVLPSLLLTATAMATGCITNDIVDPTLPPPTLLEVILTPASVALDAGELQQFAALGRMDTGDTVEIAADYSATGGEIASDGLYTAGQTAGDYEVIATEIGGNLADTAVVTISPSLPGNVTDLAVVGQTATTLELQLTEVSDGTGNPAKYAVRFAPSPISWGSASSSEFTVSGVAIGAVLPFEVTGLEPDTQYDVQCIAYRGTLDVDAVFAEQLCNVATGTTESSPFPEPTILFHEDFEDQDFASRGWYDNTALTTTASEATSGSRSLEVHFTAGATGPTYGLGPRHLFAESETVYLSYWVKYSANWVGSGQSFHPHEFHFITNADDKWVGPAFTNLTTYIEHNYQNGGIPVLSIQDGRNIDTGRIGQDLTGVTESRAVAGCNGNTDGYPSDCYPIGNGLSNNGKSWRAPGPSFRPTPGPGYKNDWHFVEAYFELNSIVAGVGVPDGVVRYWFDGELVIDKPDVLMRTGAHADMMFNQFLIAYYIGAGSPVDQTAWIDDLTVATSRVSTAPATTGVARVTVAGFDAAAQTGGYATVTPINGTPGSAATLNLPTNGSAEAEVSSGTHSLRYSPPAGYTLAPGIPNPQEITVVEDSVTSLTLDVVVSASAAADIYGHGFDDGTGGKFTNGAGASPIGNGWVLDGATSATGPNSIRQDYPQRNSNLGIALFYDLPSVRQAFYVRFAYKQASDWPNNDDMKVQRAQASNKNGQFGSFLIRGGSSRFWYFWDDLEPTIVLYPNVNLPAPTANELRGEWHWYEIYRDISVDGQLVVKIWIDDVLYFDYVTNAGNQGVTYRRLQFDGTVNSLSNASSAWFDEIGISSTKMGIPAGAPGQR